MTLKQFMEANANKDALLVLTNDGETTAFAKVSVGSVSALSTDITGKTVTSFNAAQPQNIQVTISAGV